MKNSCNLGRGWGPGGEGGDDQLKKLAASEMVKASAKGKEEVACGFLIKHCPWRSVFKGGSFFRKLFYILDINNHSKTSVSFSLYLIQNNKAESHIKNRTLYHATRPD